MVGFGHSPSMTITRLETFSRDQISIVRLTTEDGETGLGQLAPPGTHASPGTNDVATDVFHLLVAPHALGEDPGEIADIVDRVMEKNYKFPGTFVLRALCGLDTALWDLRGTRAGASVVELLGGPSSPDPVEVYASRPSRETDTDEEVEVCRRYHEATGVAAFKFKIGKRLGFRTDEDEWPGRTEALVAGLRAGLGEDIDLLVDANCGFSPERAIEVGREVLEPNGVIHFEEPCPYWELDWLARVRAALDVPIAGGEEDILFRQWAKQWERIVETGALDIVQPDLGYLGGITRGRQLAELAAEAGLPVVPHSPNHTLLKVVTLHFLAAIENTGPYPFEWRDPAWHHYPQTEGLFAPDPHVEDGALAVPSGPGWGVEISDDWLASATHAASTV